MDEKEKEFQATLEGLSDEEKTKRVAEREALLKNTEIENALKAEHEKREAAERELAERDEKAKKAFEERERKRKEEGEEKPLTKSEMLALMEENREKDRKASLEERALETANKLTGNPKEAELYIEVWRNRKLFGSLENQLREAKAISEATRTQAENEELKRALLNKDGISGDGTNAQRKPPLGGEPKLDENDKTVLKGWTWTGTDYTKVIAGGKKILHTDRQMKKRWVTDAPRK